jgi:hypothetical protein
VQPRQRPFNPLTLALFAAATLAAVLTLWIVPYLPTNDGPHHVFLAYLSSHLRDDGKGYADFVRPSLSVTSLAFHTIDGLLVRVLEWKLALKVALSVGVAGWCLGFFYFVTSLDARRAWLALFGPATVLAWNLYMGLWSFWMASGASLFLLGFALRHKELTPRRRACMASGLFLLSVAHSFAAALAGLALLGFVLVRHRGGDRVRQVIYLGLSAVPWVVVAWLSATFAKEGWEADRPIGDGFSAHWLTLSDRATVLWKCFVGGPAWRAMPPVLLAVLGFGVAIWAAAKKTLAQTDLAVLASGLAICTGSLLSPWSLNAWEVIPPRFVPLGVALGLSLLPVERLEGSIGVRRLLPVLLFAFASAAVAWAGLYHRRLYGEAADALMAASQPLRRHGPRLPLILVPEDEAMLRSNPHSNVGDLLALEQGGMTPHLFATVPGLHPFVFLRPRRELFPPYAERYQSAIYLHAGTGNNPPRDEQLAWMALLGLAYEDVILWADREAVERFMERGYAVDFRQGNVAILRAVPCGLDVVVDVRSGPLLATPPEPAAALELGPDGKPRTPPPSQLADPLLIQYGLVPLEDKVAMAVFPKGAAFANGEAAARFEAPCGPSWVRVVWDRDQSGKAGPRDLFCQDADEKGRLLVTLTRTEHLVRCRAAAWPSTAASESDGPPRTLDRPSRGQ